MTQGANHDQLELIYGIDDKPPLPQTLMLGLQHYLTMFGSTLAIPLLMGPKLGITDPVEMGWLIGTMFFVSGITTLLQTTFGNKLPIVQGGTFDRVTLYWTNEKGAFRLVVHHKGET